ncbi:MAG: type II secretion system protein GspE, partial [candidate division Zixibacteria bacterium]|nr:type II secretion system protein GspE [candidate division Zixibacteria bacterium]
LGDILVTTGKITSRDLVDALSERLNIPKISIRDLVADPEVVNIIPLAVAKKHRVLALFRVRDRLTVAMVDPLDMVAIDEIRYKTKLTVNRVIATPEDIEAGIAQFYTVSDSVERFFSDYTAADGAGAEDAPIVRLVDVLLGEAIKQRTSDVHIEPGEDELRVRFRVDGVLREEAHPPTRLHPAMVARIKVLAGMDVSEKRLPQDGRFDMKADDRSVDLRVSTLPTVHGEKVVIRVLDQKGWNVTLDNIGLTSEQEHTLRDQLGATEGMVLITGPTGSGKTSTLYASLREIVTPEKNVVTVEDPVEYALRMVNQVQVHEKAGLTFPSCLRALMRQNPDVIMVGEIRDAPTAQIAVRAAMTGHLVLSTIHTIDAAAAAHRLIDMGTEPFLVATALRAVVAQRLVRRLCTKCAQPIEPSPIAIEQLGFSSIEDAGTWRSASGCRHCRGTGYAGQIGVFEMFAMTDDLRTLITEAHGAARLREYLREHNCKDLIHQGRALVAAGLTTAEEILRVIPRRSELWEAIA